LTKKSAKGIRRRHLAIVVLLFAGVGALVVMANLRTPLNLPLTEPPEITAKRLDKENNAYYVLMEAADLLPQLPPPIELKDETGFPYAYKPEEGSIGILLDIERPDDDPLLLQYIEKSRPAFDRALRALEKPWFFHPADPAADLPARNTPAKLWRMLEACFVQAKVHSCSEDPREDACQFLYDATRISSVVHAGSGPRFSSNAEAAAVIQKASPDHQRKIAEWLVQFRNAWHPPTQRMEEHLRSIYLLPAPPEAAKDPLPIRLLKNAGVNRLKKNVYQHEDDLRKAAGMTYVEYDRYRKEHPGFLDFNAWGMGTPFLAWNSTTLAAIDGLLLVVALESCRRDRGEYPDALDALVPKYMPELPKNPFDGQDFTYARVDGTYVLSCVGGHRSGESWQDHQHYLVYAPNELRSNYWRKLRKTRPSGGAIQGGLGEKTGR
jgi:hypothetical protein